MENSKKIMIIGAGGMLGTAMVTAFENRYQIFAMSREIRPQIANEKWIPFDIFDVNAVNAAVRELRPDVIINTASSVFVNQCERDKEGTRQLHVGVSKSLTDAAKTCGAQYIYISTDSVFSGEEIGLYKESDPTNPINFYSLTKLEGEEQALEYENTLVLRSNIFGWRRDGVFSFSEWVLDGIREKKPLTMLTDVLFTPISTFELARIVGYCIDSKLTGRFHAGGRDYLSKFEFALQVADAFGLSASHLVATSIANVDMGAPRPKNTGLNCSSLEQKLGVQMPRLSQSIEAWMNKK